MKRSGLLQAFIVILLSRLNLSLCLLIHRHKNPCVHRRPPALLSHSESNGTHENDNALSEPFDDSRRSLVRNGLMTLGAAFTGGSSLFGCEADARGLVRFPCNYKLLNTYHFMRAGSSLLEVDDVWSTNPLFLTNREAALSEEGEIEVRQACNRLKNLGISPTIVRYSIAASCIDTANIVGAEFNIGRDRLVPEFNYMDVRAIGGWDYSPKNKTESAVWAMDVDEAGQSGLGGRPPPNDDGTPSETLADQVVRLTNLLSVLETLYSGDEILLIFPDGTGPALLSCLIGGIRLDRVHELNFEPSEVRENVDYSSVNAIMTELPSPYYSEIIECGRKELRQLRENPNEQRNVKDLKFEEEQLVAEAQKKEKQEQEERKARQNELDRRQKLEDERRRKEEQRKERLLQAQQREIERERVREESDNSSDIGITGGAAAAAILLASSSAIANSKQSAVIDTDNPDQNDVSNVTITEANSVEDVEEIKENLSIIFINTSEHEEDDIETRERDEPVVSEIDATTVSDSAFETNMSDDPDDDFEDTYDWGDTWLGTINEIMNEETDLSTKSEQETSLSD